MVDSPAACTKRKERGTRFPVGLRPDVYTLPQRRRWACVGQWPVSLPGKKEASFFRNLPPGAVGMK
jgi:hypothetical protein